MSKTNTRDPEIEQLLGSIGVDYQSILQYLPGGDPTPPAMLVGSVAEGFGNSTSDIDILVVGELDVIAEGLNSADDLKGFSDLQSGGGRKALVVRMPTGGTLFHPLLAGHRVQLEVLSGEYISRRVRGVRSVLASSRGQSPDNADADGMNTFADFRIMHRFVVGRALQGAEELASYRQGVTQTELSDYFAAAHNITLNAYIEDFVGVREKAKGAEIETELLLLDRSMSTLGQLMLAAAGETSPGEKFIFRLHRRHQGKIGEEMVKEFARLYGQLSSFAGGDISPVLAFIDRALDRCEDLSPFFKELTKRTNRQRLSLDGDWHRSN